MFLLPRNSNKNTGKVRGHRWTRALEVYEHIKPLSKTFLTWGSVERQVSLSEKLQCFSVVLLGPRLQVVLLIPHCKVGGRKAASAIQTGAKLLLGSRSGEKRPGRTHRTAGLSFHESIIRVQHESYRPFLLVSKETVRDKDVSFEMRGFLVLLLAKRRTGKQPPEQVAEGMRDYTGQRLPIADKLIRAGRFHRRVSEEAGRYFRFGSSASSVFEDRRLR